MTSQSANIRAISRFVVCWCALMAVVMLFFGAYWSIVGLVVVGVVGVSFVPQMVNATDRPGLRGWIVDELQLIALVVGGAMGLFAAARVSDEAAWAYSALMLPLGGLWTYGQVREFLLWRNATKHSTPAQLRLSDQAPIPGLVPRSGKRDPAPVVEWIRVDG